MKYLSHVRLRDPMDCSLPGSSVHGIFQTRVLEWGAIAFSTRPLYLDLNPTQLHVRSMETNSQGVAAAVGWEMGVASLVTQ